MFDKHLTPNLAALAVVLISFLLPAPWQALALSTGLFALSGSLTNWLAVHMLFERVPGLYGSGVITLHFEEFKAGILRMVHEELFSKDKVERLLASPSGTETSETGSSGLGHAIDLAPMLGAIDLDSAYDQLVQTIMESSFGSMLSMVGGETALQPLREPFKKRMHAFLDEAAKSPRIQSAINEQLSKAASSESFVSKLDQILRARLDEMTPEMVRDIMQRMIKKHLGWLVVWGGVFGALIGFAAGLAGLAY
ncbi:MAG: DUF445 domain-containing protein [Granulosicoccus sp.]